jgi:acyl carrier protein
MNRSEVVERVGEVLREFFDDPSLVVTEATTAADVKGWDSFSQVQIIFDMEEAFGVRFAAEDIMALNSVRQLVDKIAQA